MRMGMHMLTCVGMQYVYLWVLFLLPHILLASYVKNNPKVSVISLYASEL